VTPRKQSGEVHTVVKVGGGMLSRPGAFDRVAAAIGEAARGRRLTIVPGGGPFADAVRHMFNRFQIGDEAAHWMAILGMDQYAHALTARISGAALAEGAGEVADALAAGRIPVLAPYRWLRAADPLPHSWEVTSDSIAAWFAGVLGARRLVLIKPAVRQPLRRLVDPHFVHALPPGVEHLIVSGDDPGQLERTLREGGPARVPAPHDG
jgi:5-(aminomethyl)-3-furanmethanol phosphate kinase